MAEYGIFSDEGLVEGALPNEVEAQVALGEHRADAEKVGADPAVLYASEICPDHEEQPRKNCEECFEEVEEAEHDAEEDTYDPYVLYHTEEEEV